jgi:hypothetical protein
MWKSPEIGQIDVMEEMRVTMRIFSSACDLLGGEGIGGMHVKDDRPQKVNKTQQGDK